MLSVTTMELLRQGDHNEIDECGTGRKRDSVIIRFFRKKYKCMMMFLCILALVFQTVYLIIEKTDSEHINVIMSNFPNITRKIVRMMKIIRTNFEHNFTDQEMHTAHSSSITPEYD